MLLSNISFVVSVLVRIKNIEGISKRNIILKYIPLSNIFIINYLHRYFLNQ